MTFEIVKPDNHYFEVIEMACCNQRYRIDTEYIQYGITDRRRQQNRQPAIDNHKCEGTK